MAEKRLSVRLVATGAESFWAELRNIGTEGARALGLIEAAGPRAGASLDRARVATGEAARQLDEISFRSARAADALRAMGGATTEVAERIERLTGVSGGLARDAADIEAYGQALDDLQARFSPVFAAQLEHRRQVAEINEAHRVGAISADELAVAIVRSRTAMEAATQAARAREAALMGLVEQETLLARVNRATGVSGGLARDAADIEAYGQALDDLQARFSPVFAAQLEHRRQVAEINEAHRVGAISADELAAAIVRSRTAMEAATQAARAREAALMGLVEQETLLARVNRLTGVTSGAGRDAADIEAFGQALDDMRARFNPAFAAQRTYEQGVEAIRQAHAVGAITADEMTAAIARQARALQWTLAQLQEVDTTVGEVGRSTQYTSHRMANLSFQLQDIGVSLAGGMNPFLVMAQQGSQIAQIYGFGGGGVTGLVRDLGGMVRAVGAAVGGVAARFPVLTAAVATFGTALVGVRAEVGALGVEAPGMFETARAMVEVLAGRIRDALAPAFAVLRPAIDAVSGWVNAAMVATWDAVKAAVNGIIQAFQIGLRAIQLGWEGLPDAIGGFVVGAANVTIKAVNDLVERVVQIINRFLEGLEDRLRRIQEFTGVTMPEIGRVEVDRFDTLENPFADRTAARLAAFAEERERIRNSDPVGGFLSDVAVRILANRAALEEVGEASAGAAERIADTAATAAAGWLSVSDALRGYARDAMDWGSEMSEALVSAFRGAEEAFTSWIRQGKVDFRELAESIIADLARIALRRFVLGPVAGALGGIFARGGLGGLGGFSLAGGKLHDGGMAGRGAPVMIDTAALLAAPRLHGGGAWLGPDEVPAVLRRDERVLSPAQTREWERGGATVNIYARDVESFRASRAQIGADIVRAIAFGRRSV